MKSSLSLAALVCGFLSLNSYGRPMVVHAEGRASSPIAEHVVRKLARSRAFASARHQCARFHYKGEPTVIPDSGYDTAHYQNGSWYAHYFADFNCRKEGGGNGADMGPWLSEDETLEFLMIPGRVSWWQAMERCSEAGWSLPDWQTLSDNWLYLKGTTPVQKNASFENGCASTCPVYFWTHEEKSKELAYEFGNVSYKKKDPRGMLKSTRYSVLCYRVATE